MLGSFLAIPRTTRLVASLAACLSVATTVPVIGPLIVTCFALVPQSTIGRFFLWNVTTSGFFEPRLLTALLSVPSFVALGRWIEPVWGGKEFALFAVVVNTTAGISAFASLMGFYVATRSQHYMCVVNSFLLCFRKQL